MPKVREVASDIFDRIRKEVPDFQRIRPFANELALESAEIDGRYQWVGLRPRSIGTGYVNPVTIEDAYRLHRLLLELSPYYLSITPLDVEYIELVFGFDLHGYSKTRIYAFLAERYLSYWFTKNTKSLSWPVFKHNIDLPN